jgi:curved DNA-binding protein
MPTVKYRNYYEILGVPRDADAKQIQAAFRKLAREWHPDRHPKNRAEAEKRFKEINEANEVLSDPEKRRKYDLLGPNYQEGQDFTPPPGTTFGAGPGGGVRFDFGPGGAGATGFSDFFENLFGGMGNRATRGAGGGRGPADMFGGTPFDMGGPEAGGGSADIQAEVAIPLTSVTGGKVDFHFQGPVRCPACGGSGRNGRRLCETCHGAGMVERNREITVTIPRGIEPGKTIRIPGQGKPNLSGGPDGDLLLTVKYQPHPLFEYKDGRLEVEVPVAPWEAALGATVDVPTLDGQMVSLRIPPRASTGLGLRIKGHGLPGRDGGAGDLLARLKVVVPPPADDRERKLYEELAKLPHADVRAELYRKF